MARTKRIYREANNYIDVIDALNASIAECDITVRAVAKMLGLVYITTQKYLRKERNIVDVNIANRMKYLTEVLNDLLKQGKLPIDPETNHRKRSEAALLVVAEYLQITDD